MLKKLFRLKKRVRIFLPKSKDIVIFSKTGSEELLQYVISDKFTHSIYDDEILTIYLNLKFLIKYFANLIKYRKSSIRLFKYMYLTYILTEFILRNPKIVITYIDDHVVYHHLSKILDNINFIAIQNGTRQEYHKQLIKNQEIHHDYYFCFGVNDIKKQRSFKWYIKNPIPIGSLRVGISLDIFHPQKKIYDICYISEWKKEYPKTSGLYGKEKSNLRWSDFSKFVDDCIFKFYKKNNVRLVVALRTKLKEEKEYFLNNFGSNVYFTRSTQSDSVKKYTNYRSIMQSHVTIGFSSTLLVESLTLYTKVLSIDPSGSDKYFDYEGSFHYRYSNFDDLEMKINQLLNSKDINLQNNSSKYKEAMNIDMKNLPQEIIKNTLLDILHK